MKDNKDEVKELVTQYKHQDSEIEITKAKRIIKRKRCGDGIKRCITCHSLRLN